MELTGRIESQSKSSHKLSSPAPLYRPPCVRKRQRSFRRVQLHVRSFAPLKIEKPVSISSHVAVPVIPSTINREIRSCVAFNALNAPPPSQMVGDLVVLMYIFSLLLLLLSCSIRTRHPGTASNVSEDGTFGRPTEPETAGSIIIIVIVVVIVIMRSFT